MNLELDIVLFLGLICAVHEVYIVMKLTKLEEMLSKFTSHVVELVNVMDECGENMEEIVKITERIADECGRKT